MKSVRKKNLILTSGISEYLIGIVIPVYQTKFIRNLIDQIQKTVRRNDFCICVVNDGKPNISGYLNKFTWPQNVFIESLEKNSGFSAANNHGWKYLSANFPSIKYLGTLNDDTKPYNGWLDVLFNVLEYNHKTAIAAPVQIVKYGLFQIKKEEAIFKLGHADRPWIPVYDKIEKDTIVPAVSGFCFIGRKAALEDVNFFDTNYMNSGEDLDLCLKMITKGWKIVVCKDARILHYGGSSRYLPSAEVRTSEKKITERWGYHLEKYNDLVKKTEE